MVSKLIQIELDNRAIIKVSQRWEDMLKILIDADGCPVVEETIDMGLHYNISVIIVADTSHEVAYEGVKTIMVDKGRDRTDFVLLQNVEKNDIVITQDYGLATLVLSRQAVALSQNGLLYTNDNINALLTSRYQGAMMRKHRKYGSAMKKRTREDNLRFIEALDHLLSKVVEESYAANISTEAEL